MISSTFGERFLYARLHQQVYGIGEESDGVFAAAIGVGSSSVTAYKTADEAPPANRTLAIAQRCGVDPGWLSFGEMTTAQSPIGFERWIGSRRNRQAGAAALRVAEDAVFGDGSKSPIPTREREVDSLEQEEVPPTRATGTVGRPGAKKRR